MPLVDCNMTYFLTTVCLYEMRL